MGIRLGRSSKLYRNTATYGSPTWAEIEIVRDLSAPASREEINADSRASAFKLFRAGLMKFGVDFELLLDHSHTDYLALLAAYTARTAIDYFVCTGAYDTVGEYYVRFDGKLFDFSQTQPLKGVALVTCNIKPCYSSNALTFGKVS